MAQQNENEISNDFRAALQGDESAYRRFFGLVTPIIRHIVVQKVANTMPNDIDDIVQDVLFALHLKRHTWQQSQPVLPWIYAITRYRCIDYLRKNARTSTSNIDDVPEKHFATEDDFRTTVDLPRAIAQLSGRLGKVAKAMGLEGKSAKQTGQELGMTENAVRIAFHRAIKQLRGTST